MKLTNAAAKLMRNGWVQVSVGNPFWTFRKDSAQIELGCNPADSSGVREVVMIDARKVGRKDEPESDYHGGTFCESIAGAMDFCARMEWAAAQ